MGATSGDDITITYSAPVQAFGFDGEAFQDFSTAGTITVFDLSNTAVSTFGFNVLGGAGETVFYGFRNDAGIGRVLIDTNSGILNIDDHTFGTAITAAPEPGTMALVAMGLVGTAGMVIRRKA